MAGPRTLELLERNGGFTINHLGLEVTKGFAVSTDPQLTRVIKDIVTASELFQYVSDNFDVLVDPYNGKVFGGWLDTQTGWTYLDVITVVTDREESLRLASMHGEIAVYDLGTHEEIRVNYPKSDFVLVNEV